MEQTTVIETLVKKHYDVVFIGGGISASFLAISLLRNCPSLNVLIIEQGSKFENKPGESTSDLTSLFLNRFGIHDILAKQTRKTGLRFFFNEGNSTEVDGIKELSSPSTKSPTNGYHLNRSEFDEDLLAKAAELGAEVFRPATVKSLDYKPLNSQLVVEQANNLYEISVTWVIDASGIARIGCKAMGWESKKMPLNTTTVFAHIPDVSATDVGTKHAITFWDTKAVGPNSNSTMHYMRHGSWWWQITRSDGNTSLGVIFDTEIVQTNKPQEYFKQTLREDAHLKQICQTTSFDTIKHLPNLPFISNKLYAPGLALIGDAACFIDPLFSPGIEFICQQTLHLESLLTQYFKTNQLNEKAWNKYEKLFLKAFADRTKLYQNRYKIMGSYDLFANWIQFDFLVYMTFSVIPTVIFPSLLKYPLRFNVFTEWVYSKLAQRYEVIYKKRVAQSRKSTSLKNDVTLTYIDLSSKTMMLLQPLILLYIWVSNYIRIEVDELKAKHR